MKKIVKILPFYEPRMWGGGDRLEKEFHYHTDVKPLGEVYNVVALKGHADCDVPEMKLTLSALYKVIQMSFPCASIYLIPSLIFPCSCIRMMHLPEHTMAGEENRKHG